MKKLLSLLLAVLLVISIVPFAVSAQEADEKIVFTYKADVLSGAEANGNVTVDVYLNVESEVARFWSFDIALSYNEGLTLTDVQFGNILPNGYSTPLDIANDENLVSLFQDNGIFGGDVTAVKGEHLVATLSFKVEEAFNGSELQLFFEPEINGTVVRRAEYENGLTVEFIPVKEVVVINYGDVNDDGRINGRDYGMLMQHLNDFEVTINLDNSDVSGDGKINGRDYGLLMQYLNDFEITLGPKN